MKAYWWRGGSYPNLGDELTPIILRRLYGVEAVHSPIESAELAAAGSLLGWGWGRAGVDGSAGPLKVVGSGFMSIDESIAHNSNIIVISVRGHLSKIKLGALDSTAVTVGDPGLLVSKICNRPRNRCTPKGKIAVIFHHKHAGNDELKARFDHLAVDFVDIRMDDIDSFVDTIGNYEGIISQSLHGLVVADSLGIPNAWMELGPIHSGGSFKFDDYFSTVGRPPYLKLSGVPKNDRQIRERLWSSDPIRIERLQRSIDIAFQRALYE